jgi:hypothetical protein
MSNQGGGVEAAQWKTQPATCPEVPRDVLQEILVEPSG